MSYQYKITQNYTSNVHLSNLQHNKLKPVIKNSTEISLNLSSNVIDDSNDKSNFRYRILSTYTQVSRLFEAFENNSSTNIKLLKIQISKTAQLTGFLNPLLDLTVLFNPEKGTKNVSNKKKIKEHQNEKKYRHYSSCCRSSISNWKQRMSSGIAQHTMR